MLNGSRMIVMPVMSKAMMNEGQIPMRMKTSPMKSPKVAKIISSAKRTPRKTAKKAIMSGISMALSPQK